MEPVALVTGGSRGIGRGICLALAKSGYRVVVNYSSNAEAAQETCKRIGSDKWIAIQASIANRDDRSRLVEETLKQFGRIDLLVNNAGISSVGRKDILVAEESSWDAVLDTNLKGPYFLTQLVANKMIAMGTDKLQRPAIINISSLSAVHASTNRGDYCISKAGMSMLTQLFAIGLAPHGIRVFEVRPGIIDTDMTAAAKDRYKSEISEGLTPIRRMGTPEDVGQAVAMLATNNLLYSTGEVLNVDGGFHLRRL